MSNTFAALKKTRTSSFDKLNEQLQKSTGKQQYSDDENYWKPEVDKGGNGYAIIRFLPAPEGEEFPYVKVYDHGFKGPGGWYIERSLNTLGQTDPVSEYRGKLYNSGNESDKKLAGEYKRRTYFHSNIYVVKDAANPQNEGKVFLFKYGKKIMEKLLEAMNPQFEGESPVNPFDLWEGADFRLKIRNYEGYRNYDRSDFAKQGPITGLKDEALSDDQLEAIWKQEYSLQAIMDPKNFKPYDELKTKFYKVIGLNGETHQHSTAEQNSETSFKSEKESPPRKTEETSVDDDDALDFFKSLAQEN